MIQKLFGTARSSVVLLGSALALSSLILSGCGSGGGGSDDYTEPETTQTAPINGATTSVLVDAATVAGWIASGQVSPDTTFDRRVVILDFGAYTLDPAVDPERIEGSCRVTQSALTGKRMEGVADATPLVATGAQMDAVIQRLGIDDNTTIVFTSGVGTPGYLSTRAYWTFRYWGFPKESLKVLDGGNTVFAAAYPNLMTTDVPTPIANTFSVRDLAALNDDLRASVGEMIEIVKTLPTSTIDTVFDARGDSYYLGNNVTSGLIEGEIVVVDGHPAGGEFLGQGALYEAWDQNGDGVIDSDDAFYKGGTFKSATDIRAMFEAKTSFSANKKATVYCTSGYSATPLFFALEAILGVDVQLYDGSWSQLGKYSEFASAGGQLPGGSPWAIDEYLVDFNYNDDVNGNLAIETLELDDAAILAQPQPFVSMVADPAVPIQSQVEAADTTFADGMGMVSFGPQADTVTATSLIDAMTLDGWMTAGLLDVASHTDTERVVLLDVTDVDSYAAGHIPGAQLWDTALHVQKRVEGPAPAVNMVLDGAKMDAMIQAVGIDKDTTIVITSSKTETYFPSRAYVLFRYWGFPKERIKVLNGYNGAWPQADMTTAPTDLPDSTLSVATLDTGAQDQLRVSLSELMAATKNDTGEAFDFRGDKTGTKSTPGVEGTVAGDYVVFEGRLNNGNAFVWKNFNEDYDNGDFRFKSAAAIEGDLAAVLGMPDLDAFRVGDYSNPIFSYCRTGYIASTGFFVLDGILGVDGMVYDGSWSQWGKMSAIVTDVDMDGTDDDTGAELPVGSAWETDTADYMSLVNYNVDHLKAVEPLNADAAALDLVPGGPGTNQVEHADFDYQNQASEADAGAGIPPAAGDAEPVGC